MNKPTEVAPDLVPASQVYEAPKLMEIFDCEKRIYVRTGIYSGARDLLHQKKKYSCLDNIDTFIGVGMGSFSRSPSEAIRGAMWNILFFRSLPLLLHHPNVSNTISTTYS